jgi:hypothetical protein
MARDKVDFVCALEQSKARFNYSAGHSFILGKGEANDGAYKNIGTCKDLASHCHTIWSNANRAYLVILGDLEFGADLFFVQVIFANGTVVINELCELGDGQSHCSDLLWRDLHPIVFFEMCARLRHG